MPIYEYQCTACEHEFEAIQKFSDAPVTDCPECSTTGSVSRKLSTPAFILNGGGWYSDGYAKKSGNGAKNGEAEGKTGSSKDSESGSVAASEGGCGHGGCGHCAA
jgi:putative FmdB family regulatory protein